MKFSWLSLQFRLLLLKCVYLAYSAFPYKRLFLSVAGHAAGTAYVAAHIARLGRLEGYRKAVAPEAGSLKFALKFYSTYARIYLMSHLIFGDAGALRSYVSVEGSEMVKRALKENRGVIILGYHYGPPFIASILKDLCDIPGRAVTGERMLYNVTAVMRPLMTPKMSYLASEDMFLAGKDARKMIRHLQQGGTLYILNDLFSPGNGVTPVDFLGRTINFSHFPFKVSQKHSVPLFFCILKEDGPERYKLVIVPHDAGGGVEEGLKSYLSLVESQIKSSPYKWTLGNDFSSWPGAE